MSQNILINQNILPQFVSMDLFHVETPWLHRDRQIDMHTLIYVIEGEFNVDDDGTHYAIKKDEVLFLKSGSIQQGSTIIPTHSKWYWLTFKDPIDFPPTKKNLQEGLILPKIPNLPSPNSLLQLLSKTHTFFQSNEPYRNERLNGYLFEILFECLALSSKDKEQSPTANASVTSKVLRLLMSHVEEKFDTQLIESSIGLHYTYIGRCFKEDTGKTIQQTFMKLKVDKAIWLFHNTSLNISEISYKLSYPNPYYFSRVFKQITGYSPRDYRKQMYRW